MDLGQMVADALLDAHLTHKQAALSCGMDAGQWSRMLSDSEASLNLRKLWHLPIAFWKKFIPKFVGALIVDRWSAFEADHTGFRMQHVPASWDGTERRKRA